MCCTRQAELEVCALQGDAETTFVTMDTASDVHCAPPSFSDGCKHEADHGPQVRDAQKKPIRFDAVAPVSFGTHALLFARTHAVVFNFRDRVPRDDTLSRVVIALFANLGLFLIFSFTQVARSPAPASMWPRLFADLACSQVCLALIAPWFFAIQARALALIADDTHRYA